MSETETTYYQDNRVHITNARAIIDSKTYAMANISSVNFLRKPPKVLWPLFFLGIGILGAITGVILLLNDGGATCLGGSIVLLIIGGAMFALNKTQYYVVIGSSSGETQALKAPDQAYVRKIVGAMNEAIIKRG